MIDLCILPFWPLWWKKHERTAASESENHWTEWRIFHCQFWLSEGIFFVTGKVENDESGGYKPESTTETWKNTELRSFLLASRCCWHVIVSQKEVSSGVYDELTLNRWICVNLPRVDPSLQRECCLPSHPCAQECWYMMVYGGFLKMGVPKNGWFFKGFVFSNWWFGGTPIYGNFHIVSFSRTICIYIYLSIGVMKTRRQRMTQTALASLSHVLIWRFPKMGVPLNHPF